MKNNFDVLVVGELNVDLILNGIDKFPQLGKEILAKQMTLTMGSSSAIFACNLSTLGSAVTFIGKLGKDNFGDHIISSLEQKEVDTSNLFISPKYVTGATIVMSFGEERANITYPGAMDHLTIDDIDDHVLESAKHLHVSSIFLQGGLRKDIVQLMKRAKSLGLSTSIDPQWDPLEIWDIDLDDLLRYVDVFMPNTSELTAITKTTNLELALDFIKKYKSVIVVKDGSNGAYLWDGDKLLKQQAFLNADVIDSIGAGDSFDSGFIYCFVNKMSWKDCLEYGALMGAINTTQKGGTGAFSDKDAVASVALSKFNFTIY